MPPTDFKYVHFGTEVFYDEKFDSYKVCDGTGEDKTCADKFDVPYDINDHLHLFKTDNGCDKLDEEN